MVAPEHFYSLSRLILGDGLKGLEHFEGFAFVPEKVHPRFTQFIIDKGDKIPLSSNGGCAHGPADVSVNDFQ